MAKLACIVMASGHSRRFGADKLQYVLEGRTLAQWTLGALPGDLFSQTLVVARSRALLALAEHQGFVGIPNPDATDDTAVTIRLGLSRLEPDTAGCMFCVADQPWLTEDTLRRLGDAFCRQPDAIHRLCWQGVPGNPVIFPAALFGELSSLPAHATGRNVLQAHPELLRLTQASNPRELRDVDTPGDLA